MNKDEMKMIEDMAKIANFSAFDFTQGTIQSKTIYTAMAEALHNAGCRKIADDEMVIKKSEYEDLQGCEESNARLFTKNCILECSNKKLKKGLEKAKQETAREIFEDIEFYGVRSLNDKVWGNHFKLTDYTILDLKIKYGIAKEKGIELEWDYENHY